jgi:glycosyltransferase involved in cell wall biosynthesis
MLPLVSVRIITYNQAAYIRQCLEGVLMQRTDFPVEIIVGEHSSSDGTQDIVLDYQRKFSDRVQVLITRREENLMMNAMHVQKACRGKYHAFCEGDDYWIDPLKLQKQVEFMERHAEVPLCFHNAFVINKAHEAVRFFFNRSLSPLLPFEDIYLRTLPTASLLGRAAILNTLPEWRQKIVYGDRLLRLWCAHFGPLGYLDEVMSVYRRHAGGITSIMVKSRREWHQNTQFLCDEFNKATNYQHADLMSRFLKSANQSLQRTKWGRAYYFLHPVQARKRVKRILAAIRER